MAKTKLLPILPMLHSCYFIVLSSIIFFSCRTISTPPQPTSSTQKFFNLNEVNFDLNVPAFFADSNSIEIIKTYHRFNHDSLPSTITIRFFTEQPIDSVAFIGNIYYQQLAMLTNKDSSLIAVWAQADNFSSDSFYTHTLHQLLQQYGQPIFQCKADNDWGTQYYVWETTDKLLQLQVSIGNSLINANEDSSEAQYYDSEFLVVKKTEAKKIATTTNNSNFFIATYPTTDLHCK
jgi:hypothetical protein